MITKRFNLFNEALFGSFRKRDSPDSIEETNKIDIDSLKKIEGFEYVKMVVGGKPPWRAIYFKYRGYEFKMEFAVYSRLYILNSVISEEIFADETLIDFDGSFIPILDQWIDQYLRFESLYSAGHIEDMLSDIGDDDYHVKIFSFRSFNFGWAHEVSWDVTVHIENSIVPTTLRTVADFVQRMESFGFECDSKVGLDSFSMKFFKKLF